MTHTYKPGDRVRLVTYGSYVGKEFFPGATGTVTKTSVTLGAHVQVDGYGGNSLYFRRHEIEPLTATAMTDEPRPLKDMPAEYVGDIYKAYWAGEPLQYLHPRREGDAWYDWRKGGAPNANFAFRRKPEPQITTDVMYGCDNGWWERYLFSGATHRLTITWTDGEPTVKVEKL